MSPEDEIGKIDEVLTMLREELLLAGEIDRSRWLRRIDEQLDKRLVAMERRDA